MDSEWIQVRMRRETADLLREFAKREFKTDTLDDAGVPLQREALSLDAAVRVLLHKWNVSYARSRRYAEKARKNTRPVDAESQSE